MSNTCMLPNPTAEHNELVMLFCAFVDLWLSIVVCLTCLYACKYVCYFFKICYSTFLPGDNTPKKCLLLCLTKPPQFSLVSKSYQQK